MAIPPDPLIVRRLSHADRLLEVGIGDRHGVAAGLVAADADVRATDVRAVGVPDAVRFRVEDVTTVDSPDEFYQVDVIYALNCPPELHGPIHSLAERVGATFAFTTLGYDQPSVPVDRETLAAENAGTDPRSARMTLYVATTRESRRQSR